MQTAAVCLESALLGNQLFFTMECALIYKYRHPQCVPVHLHPKWISDHCARQLFYDQHFFMLNSFIQIATLHL